jgi:hypothetical protein
MMTYNASSETEKDKFFHYFSHFKKGGVWPNKENRAIEPYSFIVGPGGLL